MREFRCYVQVAIRIMFAFIEDLWKFNRKFSVELDEIVHNWTCSEAVWEYRQTNKDPPVPTGDFEPLGIGNLFLKHVRFCFYL